MRRLILAILLLLPMPAAAKDFSNRLANCAPYRAQVEKILESEGVPSYFFFLMVAESSCNQRESAKGAKGFWQMMPATQRHYGCRDHADLECQTRAAARYLRRLLALFDGDFDGAIMGYSMGGTNLKRNGPTKAAKDLAWTVREMHRQR